jgi:hypothetical protein
MPIKQRASQKIRDRVTSMTIKDLNDYIESSNSKKKVIQKCKNELIRRKL